MILKTNIAKLGYYTVDGKIFLWKSDAINTAGSLSKIKYHFNDEYYSLLDWTVDTEPYTNLTELYRRRAEDIRDRYDYVVLLYSGGPDSKNMLDAFTDNNIHIDEIVNINSYSRTDVANNTVHNADYLHNVTPTLERLQKLPGFKSKITILDEVELMKQHLAFYTEIDNYSAISASLFHGSINMYITKPIWTRYVPHIWDKIVCGKKICVVLGADKPTLTLINGRYAVVFGDIPQNSGFSYYDNDFRHIDIMEQFYQGPETANIVIKQSHILKDFMNRHLGPEHYQIWAGDKTTRPSHNCPSRHNHGDLKYDIFHKLIYPTWTPGFVTPKPSNLITRPKDNWWMQGLEKDSTKILDFVLKKFVKDFNKFTSPDTSLQQITARILSKPYFIE